MVFKRRCYSVVTEFNRQYLHIPLVLSGLVISRYFDSPNIYSVNIVYCRYGSLLWSLEKHGMRSSPDVFTKFINITI